jgi:hypothetical protein
MRSSGRLKLRTEQASSKRDRDRESPALGTGYPSRLLGRAIKKSASRRVLTRTPPRSCTVGVISPWSSSGGFGRLHAHKENSQGTRKLSSEMSGARYKADMRNSPSATTTSRRVDARHLEQPLRQIRRAILLCLIVLALHCVWPLFMEQSGGHG